ncbi:MAG: hypothetical protein U0232_24410 [Thermomicrobiales bacterium]
MESERCIATGTTRSSPPPAVRGDHRAQDRWPPGHPQRRRDRLPPAEAYIISLFSKRQADTVAGAAALANVSKAAWETIVGPMPAPKWGP